HTWRRYARRAGWVTTARRCTSFSLCGRPRSWRSSTPPPSALCGAPGPTWSSRPPCSQPRRLPSRRVVAVGGRRGGGGEIGRCWRKRRFGPMVVVVVIVL
ncbi:unnamed protein product, partial [Ectocarpus sp. 12 AP-2014]